MLTALTLKYENSPVLTNFKLLVLLVFKFSCSDGCEKSRYDSRLAMADDASAQLLQLLMTAAHTRLLKYFYCSEASNVTWQLIIFI
jgi:hypothetical protein